MGGKVLRVECNRNAVYQTGYHMVWCPKYRRKVLVGKVAARLGELVAEICSTYGFRLVSLDVQTDHVHLFVSLPPSVSVSFAARVLKGITARKLLYEFLSLKAALRRNALWSPSYYVGTVGNVSAETVRRYIEELQSDRRR